MMKSFTMVPAVIQVVGNFVSPRVGLSAVLVEHHQKLTRKTPRNKGNTMMSLRLSRQMLTEHFLQFLINLLITPQNKL